MGNAVYERPEELLRSLVRFNTTNPPGNEAPCVDYIRGVLDEAGLETEVLGKSPDRTNVVARLKGAAAAPPLLMYGHVDVVTTANQDWSVDPFEGVISDGFVWGRGTLDMKGGIAMMLSALLRAKAEGLTPAGDVVFAALSDEEAGGEYGAGFLAESHPGHFKGARYAIGEFGGFPMYYAGKRFYAIQVSEKQVCWLRAVLRGPGGHASLPARGGTMAKLAEFVGKLNERRLPVHIDPVVGKMLEIMAAELSGPERDELNGLLNPETTDATLDAMGPRGLMLDAMLHNVVNPSVVRGGDKINVLPSEIVLEMDGRTLPGFGPEEMISEVRGVVGDLAEIELIRHDPGPSAADMGLFDALAGILLKADPEGVAVPLLLMGCTDARYFAGLGIQSYGFIPMNLPAGFDFLRLVHAADERIPVECLHFGAGAIYELLRSYRG
jgi:acetylornithine deacetylase/succinyl-diaminopimelate desuccinylase-like protein